MESSANEHSLIGTFEDPIPASNQNLDITTIDLRGICLYWECHRDKRRTATVVVRFCRLASATQTVEHSLDCRSTSCPIEFLLVRSEMKGYQTAAAQLFHGFAFVEAKPPEANWIPPRCVCPLSPSAAGRVPSLSVMLARPESSALTALLNPRLCRAAAT